MLACLLKDGQVQYYLNPSNLTIPFIVQAVRPVAVAFSVGIIGDINVMVASVRGHFIADLTGVWTATATKDGQTATETVTVVSYAAYAVTLNYYKYYGVP